MAARLQQHAVSMRPLLFVALFSTVAGAAGLARSGTFSAMSPSLSGIDASAPPYTTEDERFVSEIAGSILNIAAFADHFEPGDPFQVRTVGTAAGRTKFSLARRAEVFTVELPGHVWAPGSYIRLARSFMADGAGLSISEDPAQDRAPVTTVTEAGPEAVVAQNARLSRLLTDHPRSPALHERAALLLAVAAQQDATDPRAILCRMTAHLAVARALRQGVVGPDGQLAERELAALASRETTVARAAGTVGPSADAGLPAFGERAHIQVIPTGDLRR